MSHHSSSVNGEGTSHKDPLPRILDELSSLKLCVATCPLRASEGEAHGYAFQRRKDARSRHQRLFVENVGKTEGNRSKWNF